MGESAVFAIKLAFIIGITSTFLVSVLALVGLVQNVVIDSALGEVMRLISVYLPFNPAQFFSILATIFTALISFLVARKGYDILMQTQKAN